MIDLHNKGVKIRIIVEHVNPRTKEIARVRKQVFQQKSKIGQAKCTKTIVTSDYLIMGSTNFTRSGNLVNDENMIITNNPTLIKNRNKSLDDFGIQFLKNILTKHHT